jgi:hypothetical protein
MKLETYMAVVLVISGAALFWNQYQFLRVVRSRTGESFPVLGSGIAAYLARPWRLLAGFDRLIRLSTSRQTDASIEDARQRYVRRRNVVLFSFLLAGAAGVLLIPGP